MRLSGIDLNLLTSLDAILEERNVTRAARRLGVTQPAVSHALRRLRELLGDELLVRGAGGMRATPRALELHPAVRAALTAAEAVLQPAPPFEPAKAERTFVVVVDDRTSYQVLPTLIEKLAREAPGVSLAIRPIPMELALDALADDLDLQIGVFRDLPASVREETLWREDFLCVLRKGSPGTRGTFDLDRYLSLSHVFVAPRGLPGSPLDDALARKGLRRKIAVTLPNFLVAPHIVAATDLVWTAPGELARAFAGRLPLVLREPPLPVPGFTVKLRWHVRLDRDPGLAWLRQTFHAVAPAGLRATAS